MKKQKTTTGFFCWLSHPQSRDTWPCTNAVSTLKITVSGEKMYFGIAQENAHFQQHACGYFVFECLLWCSNDRSMPLVKKNLQFDGFSGCKPSSSRQGPDHWLFFSVLPLLRIMKRVTGLTQYNSPKNRLNRWIHTKKHRNTSKVSLLYLFYRRKIKIMIFSICRPQFFTVACKVTLTLLLPQWSWPRCTTNLLYSCRHQQSNWLPRRCHSIEWYFPSQSQLCFCSP